MPSEKHTQTGCQNRCRPKVERVYENEEPASRKPVKTDGQRIVLASSGRVVAGLIIAFGVGYGVGRWASSR